MLSQIITVKLKTSLQLNASLHICPFTIITEEPIHFIDKRHAKTEIGKSLHPHRQRNATYSYLPTRATNFVMYQCIITSARIQYPTAAWLSYIQHVILAVSDSTSVRTYDTLSSGCNGCQSYVPYTSAKQAL